MSEMPTSVQESVNSKSIQEIWHIINRPNLQIVEMEEGKET